MERLLADLRVALRRVRKRVGFTIVAVLSLALGIGANTAIFSLVDAILLRRAPLPDAARVAEIYQKQPDFPFSPFSYPDYRDFRDATHSIFSQVSLSRYTAASRDMGDHVEPMMGEMVNGDYFPLLGIKPVIGRLLGNEDDISPGGHAVIVLSYQYWQRDFNGDPHVVGKPLRLAGREYTVVGVAPKSYGGSVAGIAPSFYGSVQMVNQIEGGNTDELTARGNHSGFLKARLAPGASMAQARAVAARFTADMQKRYPKDWAGSSLIVLPETDIAVNPLLDSVVVPAAGALMVVVGLVLLVACANLASFLLAQARDRQRDIAIRLAIGASRRTLVQQLLTESLLLAIVGGVAGVLLSRIALAALLGAKLPVPLPISLDVSLDARVLTFAIAASAVAGLLFGLVPALQATRPAVIEWIKNENVGGGPGRRLTMRSALVIGQVAISLLLVVTAALFLRSLQASMHVDPGFGKAPAAMVWFTIPADKFDSTRRVAVLDEIERRSAAVPGVRSVGVTDNILLNPLSQQGKRINVAGFTPPKGQLGFDIDYAAADSGFFDAAGVTILRGRNFTTADGPSAPRVAIINEVLAQRFWPNQDAIGQTFRADTTTFRVIGVARTTKVRSLGEAPRPFIFGAYKQQFSNNPMLIARTDGNAERTAVRLLAVLRETSPDLLLLQTKTMSSHLAAMVLPARLGAIAFSLFAGLALALSVLGVYGVVSYAVARRTREVGIRLAVGASPAGVVRLLMREGMTLVVVGAAIGIALGLVATRLLEALLFGVRAGDPLTFVGAPLLLLAVGAVASLLPARRASRIDPARVLKTE
ncbi:MAG TPA: ABC transporter permease [Gemmatimonadaceae bacterium]